MYTDQDIEAGITALADGVQNRAVQVRYIFEMFRTNLAALVIPNGAHFLFGAAAPTAALGNEGDVYDNTVTGDRSQKQGGAWVFQYRAKGDAGRTPQKGVDYTDGHTPVKGVDYRDGVDGQSAYQLWLSAGNTGSLAVFLASLKSQSTSSATSSGSYWHQEVYDPATTDGADGEFWQTAVSLSTEKRWKKVAGAWRKFYDNTGAAATPPAATTYTATQQSYTATAADYQTKCGSAAAGSYQGPTRTNATATSTTSQADANAQALAAATQAAINAITCATAQANSLAANSSTPS